jgi:hypothetical protein
MTDVERKRMMGMVQTVECLFSENIALKSCSIRIACQCPCGRRNATS